MFVCCGNHAFKGGGGGMIQERREKRENCWTNNSFQQARRDGNQCTRRGHSLRMEHRQFNYNKREAMWELGQRCRWQGV